MKPTAFIKIFVLFYSATLFATEPLSTAAPYPISSVNGILISKNMGGDILLSGTIVYPNSCLHKDGNSSVINYRSQSIELLHYASVYDGICTQDQKMRQEIFILSKPLQGEFEVSDHLTGYIFGTLTVDLTGAVSYAPTKQ